MREYLQLRCQTISLSLSVSLFSLVLSPHPIYESREYSFMREYSASPPPLHRSPSLSDKGPSSRDSTPVSTPVGCGPSFARRPAKDTALPWFKRPLEKAPSTASLFVDSTLLEPNFDTDSFPLFGETVQSESMGTTASPLDVSRQTSTSPRGQHSNLTSALQSAQAADGFGNGPGTFGNVSLSNGQFENSSRSDSISNGVSGWANGTKPISMGSSGSYRNRRESLAASMTGGMSWGGVSVGSWIRDEFVNPWDFYVRSIREPGN